MSMTLGYWSIRGLCQHIRFLLKYVQADYKEVTYHQADDPETMFDEWLSVKYSLGLEFPNLPYLFDGDVKLTQSITILTYLGKKYNLCGETEADEIKLSMIVQAVQDFKVAFAMIAYQLGTPMETLKPEYMKKAAEKLKTFSEYLGNKDWLIGSKITYPDFYLYEMLAENLILEPTILDNYENLKNYVQRFENLPGIKEYLASPESHLPIHSKCTTWGNKYYPKV